MKPLIVFSDLTVNGFMAGPDNDLDFMIDDLWLNDELTSGLMSAADTIVWGRKSFPESAACSTTPDGDLTARMHSTLATGDGADQVRRRDLALRSARSFSSGAIAAIYAR